MERFTRIKSGEMGLRPGRVIKADDFSTARDTRAIVEEARAEAARILADANEVYERERQRGHGVSEHLPTLRHRYFIVIANPLRSSFAISPTCWPDSSSTAPFWLVSTIARAPAPTASPAPAAP